MKNKKLPTEFSSGHEDWIDSFKREVLEERQVLIDKAKEGCQEAIDKLQSGRHPLRTLTLNGVKIF